MNASEMIDYAFGLLELPERERAEREIGNHPELAEQLERIRSRLDLMLDDGEAIEPPPELAQRTLALVAEHGRRRHILEFAPATVPFRWADLAVAATILIAGLLTLMPALHRHRMRMNQAACAFNLQQLGVGLAQYAESNRCFPYALDSKAPYAGTCEVLLKESGHLTDPSILDCPSNGKGPHRRNLPGLAELALMEEQAPFSGRKLLCGDYAYSLGVRHPSGKAAPVPARLLSVVPLVADTPPHLGEHTILSGNSLNHFGRGQNVLFSDGHVGWYHTRQIGDDEDLYLNARNRPEPGVGVFDAVLVPGCFRADGR